MDQQIRFCTTAGGARIAYATIGAGPPLVLPPGWVSHLELWWEDAAFRAFIESLARYHTVVRYDKHGCGLSDRNRTEFTLESEVQQLDAVVSHLKLNRFALLAMSQGGPVGIAFAVTYPRRVSHLILYSAFARGSTVAGREFRESFTSLVRVAWGVGSKTLADMFLPNGDAAALEWLARFQREAATAEMAARLLSLTYDVDVTDLLPRIRVPTLVVHRRHDRAHPFRAGRELASLLPNTRFIPLEGNEHMPYLGDDDVLRAIYEFLGDPADDGVLTAEPAETIEDAVPAPTEHGGSAPPAHPRSLLTILFTDIEESTALMQRLGDAGAREVLRIHERIVRQHLAWHGGTEIKTLGDGFMASFASASSALECAIALQQAFAAHNEQATTPIRVRVGLNAGEPIAEGADLFGTAVNLAARVAAHASGGQILATDVVRQLVAGKGFLFSDRGAVVLRGFEDAVRLFEVSSRPDE